MHGRFTSLGLLSSVEPTETSTGAVRGCDSFTLAGVGQFLRWHPDQQFRSYVVDGIRNGFRLGFDWSSPLQAPSRLIMPSAEEHPKVISEYLASECREGRVPFLWIQVSSPMFTVVNLGWYRRAPRENGD